MKTVIVFSTPIQDFMQNRILDRTYMSQFPAGTLWTDLAEAARAAGYGFMTADIFLEQHPAPRALLISDMGAGYPTPEFIPAVCYSLESPIVAYRFYHDVARAAGSFAHTFLWSGVQKRLKNTEEQFHPVVWPNPLRTVLPGPAWRDRLFLVLINSNKRAFQFVKPKIKLQHPKGTVSSFKRYFRDRLIRLADPWMRSELYLVRLEAIERFARYSGFDLYGRGWEQPIPRLEQRLRSPVQRCYRGSISPGTDAKLQVLQQYKFSLCFENTAFPGYITEKICDCFFAGCIPVYLGAPDILEHIPRDAFVDVRDFADYDELGAYLEGLSEREAERYQVAARDFLASSAFNQFYVTDHVDRLMAAIQEVAEWYA